MKKRQRQILDLLAQGYCVEAIACKLNIKPKAVATPLRQLHVHLCVVPPGYIPVSEAARRVAMAPAVLRIAILKGDLKFITYGKRRHYTTMAWVHLWIRNHPYRKQAKEMQKRLFKNHPTG